MRAVQYSPKYCAEAKADLEASGPEPFTRWDSSHDLSVITDEGERIYIGSYRSAAEAQAAGEVIERTGILPQ